MRSHKTIWIACLCLAGVVGCDNPIEPGGEGGMGGSISGAGGGGGEGGNCIEPSVDPDDPMYDRFEGTAANNACRSDDDCVISGCSGEICAAEGLASTCEGLPSTPEGGCGCIEGVCIWNVDSCDPEPCSDIDNDEICDADDFECNADGTPLQCRQAAPRCEAGTVPEILNNCYSGRCVAWDQCGVPACDDADNDGICDERDIICGDNEILCDGPEPRCERGTVPVAVNGCFTGDCTTWDRCGEPACEDADNDGVCDGRDFECNADGTPLQCRQAPPRCEAGTVPEIRNNCYTRRCVTWEMCGEPLPCADVDEDGICDERDEVCGDNDVLCDAIPPLCEAGTVPVALNGCWTRECTTWDQCSEQLACSDTDGDGTCDTQDSDCNADGTPLRCRRVAPRCERGTVPEIRNGCYTDRCVTWEMCGGAGCDDADQDGICDADDHLCESDGSQLQCRRVEPVCERGTHPEVRGGCYTDRCLSWEMCAEATAAEGCVVDIDCGDEQSCQNGACVDVACIVPTVSPRDPMYGRYEGIGANNACRQDADCVRGGCSSEICAAEPLASTCEVVPIPNGDCGCVEGVCIWHIDNCDPGPAACDPIRDGEFGLCRAILGWGISAETGECGLVSGCGCNDACEGRVFPSERACLRSCGAPVVVEPDHPNE